MTSQAVHPEYLISQLTHTCLTVISGTSIHDAVIGMANCSGSSKQQWFQSGGLWRWGGDQNLCLFKSEEEGKLCLALSDDISEYWVFDEDMRLTLGTQALTVSGQGAQSQVIVEKMSSGLKQKWWTLSQLEATMEGHYLAGEHSLTPSLLEMCKKEIDKSAARKRSINHRRQVQDQCQGGEDLVARSCEGEVICSEECTASPEYLINQHTLTCLTVMDSNGPDDATIELSPFTGGINQQWLVNGKQWHWMGNRSYCLLANEKKGAVRLGELKKNVTSWNFNESGFLKTKSKVLQASLEEPQTRVTLAAKSGGQHQKWWKLSEVRAALKVTQLTDARYPEALVKIAEQISPGDESCSLFHEEDGVSSFLHEGQGILTEDKEYLVNQSTHTCLAVLSGPLDAVIGLAPYNGNSNQQWLVCDGTWRWAHNHSLCLAPDFDENCLRLVSTGDEDPKWDLDKEGFFMNGSHAVGISEDDDPSRLSLQPKLGVKTQKWWTLSGLKSYVGLQLYPLPVNDIETYRQEINRGIINSLTPLIKPLPHPRDVGHYPGSVPAAVPRTNFLCVLKANTVQQRENIRMRAPKDWQATNMYVVAGDIFIIVLPDDLPSSQAKQISVKVGAQTDRLKPTLPKIQNHGFKRMPIVSEDFYVNPGINFFRSQYGGNLIFLYEGEESFTVTAEVQNVVESPHYILGVTNEEEWERMRTLNTPFCVLESNKVVLVVPTSRATEIPDIDVLLQRYDDIIEKMEDLSGFSEGDPPPQGKQWLVDDIQITAGSAHAGFPIMFQHQFNDLTLTKTPYSWAVWHEIGHNYQQRQFWSHAYGSESTVNLFSLYIQEKLEADDRLKSQNKYKPTSRAVDDGLTLEGADCWQKLIFMMEIKHAFPDHGWDIFRHLNRVTRTLEKKEADSLKARRQRQYDHAYRTMSKQVGSDLIRHYERWSVPVSENAREEIESLGLPKAPANLSAYCP
ncbi:uncharacterized protein LOC135201043 [Macrobrachium nipponense]|uniref:uncharacterized protein LOC135201043 n=1 Tax=Macrobrachium nipponense TaxID=159736 RepID=UPI0030C8366F